MLWAAVALNVAVTVETPPFSAIGEVAERLTVGPASLSVRLSVSVCTPFSVIPIELVTELMSTMIVSVPSIELSSAMSSVVEAVVLPATITSELLLSV